jgi:hypothetical protein
MVLQILICTVSLQWIQLALHCLWVPICRFN